MKKIFKFLLSSFVLCIPFLTSCRDQNVNTTNHDADYVAEIQEVEVKDSDVEPDEELYIEPASEYLKVFEWLVGEWKDDSSDADITYKYSWDKDHNFLKQEFSVKVPDEDTLQGMQIFGWDPIKEQIRSWIFDSDGGFGEGSWEKQGDQWYGSVVYVLPEGVKGSAVQIIRKIDDNSYSFSVQNREVDGEFLPDVEPINIIRQKK